MPSEFYALCLRPSSNPGAASDSQLGVDRLMRIPGVVDRGDGAYEFGDADEHGVMRLDFELASIGIAIPRPWVHDRGPMVFALVFMLAEWLRWEVYDPQIEDVLVKEVVLQGMVAMRQAQREADLRGD
jgi:hypothetical protein